MNVLAKMHTCYRAIYHERNFRGGPKELFDFRLLIILLWALSLKNALLHTILLYGHGISKWVRYKAVDSDY